jgi:chromosome segregation protein
LRLEELILDGFKSFGQRTSLAFIPGINAIVGPNGSGKSNLVEAVRFVAGEGRARSMRAPTAAELIFHGSEDARPTSMAAVSLTVSGLIGPDERGVSIERRVYSDGTSQYLLAGKEVRQRDLRDLLAGTGLGQRSPAIIGQGEVGEVLTADPATLLAYLEEGAGLARLAGRRQQTGDKLDTADGHCQRLQDERDLLAARVEKLREEADAAGRHRRLTAEAHALRYTIAVRKQESLSGELTRWREAGEKLERELSRARSLSAASEESLSAARAALDVARTAEADAAREAERLGGLEALATERASRERGDEARARREAGEIEAELTQPLEAPDTPEAAEAALRAAADRRHAAEESHRNVEAAADAAAGALRAARERHEAARGAAERARAAREEAERRLREHAAKMAALSAERARLEGELERARETAANARSAADEAAGALASAEGRPVTEPSRAALEERAGQMADLERESAGLSREQEILAGLIAEGGRRSRGARAALEQALPGVLGALADLIEVAPEHELAVQAGLGRRLDFILTETADAAAEAVRNLERGQHGRATFLPLDLVRPARAGAALTAGEPGVVGPLAPLIGCADRYRAAVETLTAGTWVVEDLESGLRIARSRNDRPRLVTLAGEVIESYGALTGGHGGRGSELLGERRRLREIEERLAAIRARLQALRADHDRLAAELERQAAVHASYRQEVQEAGARLAVAREVARGREEAVTVIARRLEELAVELAEPAPAPGSAPDAPDLEPLERALEEAIRADQEATARRADAREQLSASRADETVAADRARQAQAAWASHQAAVARRDRQRDRIERLREQASAATGKVKAHESEVAALREERERIGLVALQEAASAARERVGEAEEAFRQATTVAGAIASRLEQARLTLARREASIEAVEQELAGLGLGEQVEGSVRALTARLGEVEGELGSLGEVNLKAQAELAMEAGRLATLDRDLADARSAIAELRAALDEIDRELEERFAAAYTNIRVAFHEYALALFGGGQADIRVVTHDGRRAGIEIVLQPPGKRTTRLDLLSAGERTLGALAFLFALVHTDDPSGPAGGGGGLSFAVLDEVDAPLDEANIRRFTQFVSRLAKQGTQFVLVTHQKATMEVADALWGVTTTRPGITGVFSIRMPDPQAELFLEAQPA